MKTDLNTNSFDRSLVGTAAAASPSYAVASKTVPAAEPENKPVVQMPTKAQLTLDPEKTRQQLQEAIKLLNERMQKSTQQLNFHMDDVLDFPVVTVRSTATGEVIRQIPNETVIHVAHNIDSLKGLLHNSRS